MAKRSYRPKTKTPLAIPYDLHYVKVALVPFPHILFVAPSKPLFLAHIKQKIILRKKLEDFFRNIVCHVKMHLYAKL
jgi:hypothetical protein